MKIRTYKPDKYRDCPIYFRNFKHTFEYLVIINNELYTAHIDVKPTLVNKIFYWTAIQWLYSYQQEQRILKQLKMMAQTTVDFILDKK